MTDDLEPLRRARPDRLLPDDPPDPEILAREKARLMSAITGPDGAAVHRRTPSIYPRLAYRDEVAALDFLTRAFGLVERRESRMEQPGGIDRKSTRLNSSHSSTSYAVFCLKKKSIRAEAMQQSSGSCAP